MFTVYNVIQICYTYIMSKEKSTYEFKIWKIPGNVEILNLDINT